METRFGISLFTGAGGMDVGFQQAGVEVLWANEINSDACDTYEANHTATLMRGDIRNYFDEVQAFKGIDLVFGGPPCQGFSVAGKMDPHDERSKLLFTYLDVVGIVRPKVFVCENVKALATLEKWTYVRNEFFRRVSSMGYSCYPFVLNSSDFGVPQKRERVFFIGFRDKELDADRFWSRIRQQETDVKSIRDAISHLGPAGSDKNPLTCTAKITLATNPVLRRSPYAGMIFNGLGRPLDLDAPSNTLPASMGGNKTPIVDEDLLYNNTEDNWVVNYHRALLEGTANPEFGEAPDRLRRITIKEAALIQTFPEEYQFCGSKSSIYRQIGNAVPAMLAQAVATAVLEELDNVPIEQVAEEPELHVV